MSANDPNAIPPVCPECGGTSEDMSGMGQMAHDVLGIDWECPCGATLADEDLVSEKDWCKEQREEDKLRSAGL